MYGAGYDEDVDMGGYKNREQRTHLREAEVSISEILKLYGAVVHGLREGRWERDAVRPQLLAMVEFQWAMLEKLRGILDGAAEKQGRLMGDR